MPLPMLQNLLSNLTNGAEDPTLTPSENLQRSQQRRQAMIASLLQSSGPAPVGTTGGLQSIGDALQAGQKAEGGVNEQALRRRLILAQIAQSQAAAANSGREIVPAGATLMGPNGKPIYTGAALPKSLQHVSRDLGNQIQEGTFDPGSGETVWGSKTAKELTPQQQLELGLGADGKPTEDESRIVDQIGQYRIVPSARLQATPRGQRILAAVEEKYPEYDVTTAQAKVAAAKAFTSGKEAGLLRSIGTANKHLDMLDGMVDALNNGNIQSLNRLGNKWTAETGDPAVTNFDSAKEIVGQEVVKAIVANGGGVAEREEAQRKLDTANSPAQLRGVIKTYRTIMDAQRESLLQQRRAAGLTDSTLPDYTEGSGSAPKPGWSIRKVP